MDWHEHPRPARSQQALGPTAIVYCLAAIGLNVHFGYTGLLNFGQAGFMAVAGYSPRVACRRSGTSASGSASLVGLVLTVVLALLLGVPTLRLRADYLAIVTIAAAEIIRQIDRRGDASRRPSAARTASPASSSRFRDLNPFTEPDRHPGRRDAGAPTTSG